MSHIPPKKENILSKPKDRRASVNSLGAHRNTELQPYLKYLSLLKATSWKSTEQLDRKKTELIFQALKNRAVNKISCSSEYLKRFKHWNAFLLGPSKMGFIRNDGQSGSTQKTGLFELITFDFDSEEKVNFASKLSLERLPHSSRIKKAVYLSVVDMILVIFKNDSSYKLFDAKTGCIVNSQDLTENKKGFKKGFVLMLWDPDSRICLIKTKDLSKEFLRFDQEMNLVERVDCMNLEIAGEKFIVENPLESATIWKKEGKKHMVITSKNFAMIVELPPSTSEAGGSSNFLLVESLSNSKKIFYQKLEHLFNPEERIKLVKKTDPRNQDM